jgi:predicted small lipoprotein YifL
VVACSHLTFMRIAAIGALVAALGLAGCGRKAGLDPPPAAAVSQAAPEARPEAGPGLGPDNKPLAPASGPKKAFILDVLVD